MSSKTISQAEARRLKKRVDQLERAEQARKNQYARDYPGGVHIASHNYAAKTDFIPAVVQNSRLLGHAVVVVADGNAIRFYAVK